MSFNVISQGKVTFVVNLVHQSKVVQCDFILIDLVIGRLATISGIEKGKVGVRTDLVHLSNVECSPNVRLLGKLKWAYGFISRHILAELAWLMWQSFTWKSYLCGQPSTHYSKVVQCDFILIDRVVRNCVLEWACFRASREIGNDLWHQISVVRTDLVHLSNVECGPNVRLLG